jgi:hypothetical protein
MSPSLRWALVALGAAVVLAVLLLLQDLGADPAASTDHAATPGREALEVGDAQGASLPEGLEREPEPPGRPDPVPEAREFLVSEAGHELVVHSASPCEPAAPSRWRLTRDRDGWEKTALATSSGPRWSGLEAGAYRLECLGTSWSMDPVTVEVPADSPRHDVEIERAAVNRVSGRVVRTDGGPLSGGVTVRVEVKETRDDELSMAFAGQKVEVVALAADGGFCLAGWPVVTGGGFEVRAVVEVEGFAPVASSWRAAPHLPAFALDDLLFELEPAAKITGRVLTAEGEPVDVPAPVRFVRTGTQPLPVTVTRGMPNIRWIEDRAAAGATVTGDGGAFELVFDAPIEGRLEAYPPGDAPVASEPMAFAPGEQREVTLTLPPHGMVFVTISGTEQAEMAPVSLSLTPQSADALVSRWDEEVHTGEAPIVFMGVPTGTYELRLLGQVSDEVLMGLHRQNVVVSAPGVTRVDIDLEAEVEGWLVFGLVRRAPDLTLMASLFDVENGRPVGSPVPLDETGAFTLAADGPGPVACFVVGADPLAGRVAVGVAAVVVPERGILPTLGFDLAQSTVVVAPGDEPVAAWALSARTGDAALDRALTSGLSMLPADPTGRLELSGLPPGDYVITPTLGSEGEERPFTVPPGGGRVHVVAP